MEQGQTSFFFQQQPPVRIQKNTGLEILHARPIRHYGLLNYLFERKISISTASTICREVHYLHKGRRYFAIGLKNDSGGWELRNKYCKNSSSPKDITHIKNGNGKLIVTEGTFDLLSILEFNKEIETEYDFLVLNSTALVKKAMKIINGYTRIDLYLDNDTTGKATTQNLLAHSNNCLDKSSLYEGYKDMNEWFIFKAKNGFGQEAQDVFLLPQKRSCFAPGGRKVKKK